MSARDGHWRDEVLPEPVARALAGNKRGAADDAAIARMHARLEASLGPAFDAAIERPALARSASQLRRLGWLSASAIVVLGTAGLALRPTTSTTPTAPTTPPSASAPAAPGPLALTAAQEPLAAAAAPHASEARAPAQASAAEPRASDALAEAPAAEPRASAALAQPQPLAAMPAARPRASGHTADSDPKAAVPQAEARAAAPKLRADNKARKPLPVAESAAPVAPAGLAEELSGLDQIRALMNKTPERALAAAEEQQQRFAHGALAPERALLRLDALLRLQRAGEAQELARQLLAAPANQPYRARIQALLSRHQRH